MRRTTMAREKIILMQHELRGVLNDYDKQYISKANLVFYLDEKQSPWFSGLTRNYRERLITTAMLKMGWEPYSGTKNKRVRAFRRS